MSEVSRVHDEQEELRVLGCIRDRAKALRDAIGDFDAAMIEGATSGYLPGDVTQEGSTLCRDLSPIRFRLISMQSTIADCLGEHDDGN